MKFKNLLILTILAICFSTVQAFACIQPIGEYSVGKRIPIEGVPVDEFMKNFLTHEDRAHWEKIRAALESQNKDRPYIDSRNNLAVALVHLGQIKEAIKILEEIERDKPGEYFTAANLGTAYELNGENQKALDWIKEGVKRKKQSHFGTEWLHVKILEAKLAMEKDANWLKNNSVLGANFNDANQTPPKIYVKDFLGEEKSLVHIKEALVFQLHERLEFVKAPEPVVADLLFDLNQVFKALKMPEHAKSISDLAVNYAANSKELAKGRSIEAAESVEVNKRNYYYYALPVIAALLVIGFIYIFFRRRNLR